MTIAELLCADWSKDAKKRVCCRVEVSSRRVSFLNESNLTFETLLHHASLNASSTPVCLSLDLAIGVPKAFLELCNSAKDTKSQGFLEWLSSHHAVDSFWAETDRHEDWSKSRPFIAIPKGKGSLTAFKTAAGHDLRREIDRNFGAKSPFIVSGIPGTVGSGTRSFWRELAPKLARERSFRIWPFEGTIDELVKETNIIVAETYPAVCYAAVLAEVLPCRQWLLAKTKYEAREMAVERLGQLDWLHRACVELPDLSICVKSEDHFDAFMAALAQYRLQSSSLGLFDEANCDPVAEGGILGSNAIEPGKKVRWP
ncbi:MAG: DUF429 domain-containing protein [Planctomycetota bacterium]